MTRAYSLSRRGALGRAKVAAGTVLFLDDFASTTPGADIDSTKWIRVAVRGGGNGEYDYRTSSLSNSRQDGYGNLEIVLRNEAAPDAGQPFTSARLETRGKKTFIWPVTMEARIRLPSTPGLWPAFWTDADAGGWPTTGEIDMMELPFFVDVGHGQPGDGIARDVKFNIHMGSQASPSSNASLGASYNTGGNVGAKTYTNLITNPSLETAATGYSAFGASSTGTRTAAAAKIGANGWRVTSGAAGTASALYTISLASAGLAPGDTISAGWYLKVTGAGAAHIAIQYYGSGNTVFLSQATPSAASNVTDGFSKMEGFVIPATCDTLRIITFANATASGQTIDHDCLILVKGAYLPGDTGSGLHDYADGSSTGWTWSGTAHASTSSGPGSGDYHIYRGDWYSDRIDFYYDDILRATITRAQATAAAYQWPFDSNAQCLILNLAYSGSYPGNGTTTPSWTDLRMKVDYVRVTAL